MTHDINTAAQGDTVYSDGPVIMLRRNILPPSIQYMYFETMKTESSGKGGSKQPDFKASHPGQQNLHSCGQDNLSSDDF
jgi:hypothetical protein